MTIHCEVTVQIKRISALITIYLPNLNIILLHYFLIKTLFTPLNIVSKLLSLILSHDYKSIHVKANINQKK